MRWVLMTLILKVVSFSKHLFTFIIQIIRNFKCNLKVFGASVRNIDSPMYRLDERPRSWEFHSRQRQEIFLHSKASRPSLDSTPPHIQREVGLFPRGQATGMWHCTRRLSSMEDKILWSYAYIPPYAFRMFTGTTLTFALALKVLRIMQYYKDYLLTRCILA